MYYMSFKLSFSEPFNGTINFSFHFMARETVILDFSKLCFIAPYLSRNSSEATIKAEIHEQLGL